MRYSEREKVKATRKLMTRNRGRERGKETPSLVIPAERKAILVQIVAVAGTSQIKAKTPQIKPRMDKRGKAELKVGRQKNEKATPKSRERTSKTPETIMDTGIARLRD